MSNFLGNQSRDHRDFSQSISSELDEADYDPIDLETFTSSQQQITALESSLSLNQFDLETISHQESDHKKRHELCKKLLDVIKSSVLTFKPSKSLSCLHELSNNHHEKDHFATSKMPPVAEIDVVVSGGGLKGYFMTGCSYVLKHELKKNNVRIARIAGASAGAWVGLFMLTNFGTANWLETFYLCQERPTLTIHEAYEEIWPWVNSCLPENAWEICSGRLFISITEVSIFGFKNHMISEFTSNRDLYECCMASSTVPYISLPTALRRYRNMWVVDGGVTKNTPIFEDNIRRQLVFRLNDVSYPVKFLLSPKDYCIESLVVRGAILMARFLQGHESDSFSWVYPKTEEEQHRENRILNKSFYSIIWRGLLLGSFSSGLFFLLPRQSRNQMVKLVNTVISRLK